MTYGSTSPWKDAQRVAFVTEQWAHGMSASEIADAIAVKFDIDVTRNAVIGLVHRLNLPTRNTTNRTPKHSPPIASRPALKSKPPTPKPAPVVIHDTPPRMVTLQELEPHHCRYGLGDPRDADFRFCGADKATGQPYCPSHCKICFTPAAQREQKFHHWGRRAA